MAEDNSPDIINLKIAQLNQIIDQYRMNIYQLELKLNLLVKMFEEKGMMAPTEFEKRWPMYLENDVGAIGPDGMMKGTLKVKIYDLANEKAHGFIRGSCHG